ncbi:hypothetical protein HLV39_02600 [Marinobacter adhaerens]|uniref:Uncharacterized protein n=1 Tax=Marinobacter adhaerens TaxID=1033846 RepID=A0A851HKL3_9GAMM|nr:MULTISPECIES: hypothetical protein [Marinobacter]NWN90389.1 hypothetical protein [Marinobacter adhaerens]
MKQFVICFSERETAPDRIERIAADLGITSAQLIKRFIAEGLATIEPVTGEAVPGKNLEDFLVRNDVLNARSED